MKHHFPVLAAVVLFSAGCSKKEISKVDLAQASNYASEAAFAMQIRERDRAEDLLIKATKLVPESAEYWMGLGNLRVTMDKKGGAKEAYQKALSIYKDRYSQEPGDGSTLMQEVYVLGLLGRVNDARAVLEKAAANHPSNLQIKAFVSNKTLYRMLADPAFKALAI